MSFFYLSFCDIARPEGQQFLGATVVEATDPKAAIARSWEIGVNPGGEVAIAELEGPIPAAGRKYVDKFVPRDVVLAEGAVSLTEVEGACADCNEKAGLMRVQGVEQGGTYDLAGTIADRAIHEIERLRRELAEARCTVTIDGRCPG